MFFLRISAKLTCSLMKFKLEAVVKPRKIHCVGDETFGYINDTG